MKKTERKDNQKDSDKKSDQNLDEKNPQHEEDFNWLLSQAAKDEKASDKT